MLFTFKNTSGSVMKSKLKSTGIFIRQRREPIPHLERCIPMVFLLLLSIAPAAYSEGLEAVVRLRSTSLIAGQKNEFTIFVHNLSKRPRRVLLPETLGCRLLDAENRANKADANASGNQIPANTMIGPNSFTSRTYGIQIPSDLQGAVTLVVEEVNAPEVLFVVKTPEVPESRFADLSLRRDRPKYESLDSLFNLYQPYLGNIAPYEPMYFLLGTNPEDSKFQVSFKYQFFNDNTPLAELHPWTKGFHFGYTQTSFWDLASSSAPFEDTSYKPELLFLSSNIDTRPAWMKGFFMQFGGRHESNGRGAEFSRSTNTLYAKPIFILYDEDLNIGLQIAPKIWSYIYNDDDTNPDLADYRGYFDVEFKFGKTDDFVAGATFGWANEGASIQIDLTYPLHHLFFKNLDLYLHLQYVNALAESLIDYRQRTESVRLGFSIVR